MTQPARPRAIGINHVALDVGDLEAALEFYGAVFDFELREPAPGMAFLDLGDQFLALSEGRSQPADESRHVGLVVDDKPRARAALERAGAEILPGDKLNFRDPWGNYVQVVDYREIQFVKAPEVARAMRLELRKTPAALAEMRAKGFV